MTDNIVYIGIGSNLGQASRNVSDAITQLAGLPDTRLDKRSSLYRTAPIDATGDDYINAVVRLVTRLSPFSLLHALWDIENRFGRMRPYRNAPRTLDLDILLYNQEQIETDTLIVPHPRMMDRAFVLVPLAEIDPNTIIPGWGTVCALLPRTQNQRIDLFQ